MMHVMHSILHVHGPSKKSTISRTLIVGHVSRCKSIPPPYPVHNSPLFEEAAVSVAAMLAFKRADERIVAGILV